MLLELEGVTKRFGGLTALDGVALDVRAGEVRGLIGPNGSGKSTLFHVASGVHRADGGRIVFAGEPILGRSSDAIARLGLARTFQDIQLFYDMTVLENAMVGCHRLSRAGALAAMLRPPWVAAEERMIRERAREALAFVGLVDLAAERARSIPYGHQRLLEIARALAAEPRLMLLDEPAAGMNPTETRALMHHIARLVDRGVTVFLVEHNMKMVMDICQRITVLNYGKVIASGTPAEVQADAGVVEAYLGGVAAG
ncbi:MAG: ABC transporter ATP-binding protein [Alphaproteobacteria bacterium]|nr:ABC transporter ATP-binding protein [Alphaproteobacteria bacterium]